LNNNKTFHFKHLMIEHRKIAEIERRD